MNNFNYPDEKQIKTHYITFFGGVFFPMLLGKEFHSDHAVSYPPLWIQSNKMEVNMV